MQVYTKRLSFEAKEAGFTLIELLVVILIIGILAAIAIPMFLNQRKSAMEAGIKSDLKNLGVAIETEALQNRGRYDGTIPASFKASEGNVFNVVTAEAGTTNIAAGAPGTETVQPGRIGYHVTPGQPSPITKTVDDYKVATYSNGGGFGGPYWDYKPVSPIPAGTSFTGSVKIKSSMAVCMPLAFEEHKTTPGWNKIQSAQTCLEPDVWTELKVSGETSYEVTTLTLIAYQNHPTNEVFSYKEPVIVLGKEINQSGISLAIDEKFCIEGHNESDPENIWSYSKVKGGVQSGRC